MTHLKQRPVSTGAGDRVGGSEGGRMKQREEEREGEAETERGKKKAQMLRLMHPTYKNASFCCLLLLRTHS